MLHIKSQQKNGEDTTNLADPHARVQRDFWALLVEQKASAPEMLTPFSVKCVEV